MPGAAPSGRATLVLLHGRAHHPESMHELVRRAGLSGEVDVVAPAAPGGSWYPDRFFAVRSANEPQLGEALDRIDAILDELAARGVPPERTLLGGFSQGACLACDAAARRPRPLGALAVLCGGLIGRAPEELAQPPAGALGGLPVLITATEADEWVPVERVRDSADRLAHAGARVDLQVYGPAPHGVRDDEVTRLRALALSLTSLS